MKLISNKKDLQAWFDYDKTFRPVDTRLPDSIRSVLNKTDGFLFPSHCEEDLLEEIFIDVLTKMQPAFMLDEFCKPVIKKMIQYCRGESDLNHQKGLLLMGGVGSGKTLLMRGYNKFICQFRNDAVYFYPGYSEVATYNLVSGFAQYGYEIFNKEIQENLLNNPFIYSTKAEEIATVFFTWLLYFKLLIFPHPLTHDYYPKQIPILNFSDF